MSATETMKPTVPTPVVPKPTCARCDKKFKVSKYSTDVLCCFCTNVGDKWSFAPLSPTAYVRFPAGKYYIGDLCYISDEDGDVDGDGLDRSSAYAAFDWNGFEDGLYSSVEGSFMVASTAYGDGGYEDNMGNSYGVDGGNIGIMNTKLLPKDWQNNGLGVVFDFPSTVLVRMTGRLGGSDEANGQFEFKCGDQIITIDTANFGDEEDA